MESRKMSFAALILITVLFPFFSYSQGDNAGWYPYQKANKKWCFVSVESGTILNNREFDSVVPFNSGLAKVKLNGLWGALDTKGNYVLTTEYSEITLKPNNNYYGPQLIYLQKPGVQKTGLCNYKGEMINPFYYEKVVDFLPELYSRNEETQFLPFQPLDGYDKVFQCFYGKDNCYEVRNVHGKVILDSTAIKRSYKEGTRYYIFRDSVIGIYNYKDTTGKGEFEELPFKGKTAGYFFKLGPIPTTDWYFALNKRYGAQIVNGYGKPITDQRFDAVDYGTIRQLVNSSGDSLSLFVVKRNSKYGLIDINGKLLVDYAFDNITISSESITAIKDNKCYRLNEQFEPVLQPNNFSYTNRFRNIEKYTMTKDSTWIGLSLTDGTEIIPTEWTRIEPRTTGSDGNALFFCSKGVVSTSFQDEVVRKFAVFDLNGNELVHKSKVYAGPLPQGNFYLESKRKVEVYNNKGIMLRKTRKPRKRRKEMVQYVLYQPVYEVINGEVSQNNVDFQMTFLTKKGWVVLDSEGKTIFTSAVKTGNYATIIRDNTQQLIGLDIRNNRNGSGTLVLPGGIRNYSSGTDCFYSATDGMVHETDKDSIRVMDVYFNIIKAFKNQPFGQHLPYTCLYDQDFQANSFLDSVNVLYDKTFTFTDFNFVPFRHAEITGYKVIYHNIIGKNQGKEFLMMQNEEWIENPRKYERIEEYQYQYQGQVILGYNGNQFDLYTGNGELLFEKCTDLKRYHGFLSFSCNGKTVWMTSYGKVYEPKNN